MANWIEKNGALVISGPFTIVGTSGSGASLVSEGSNILAQRNGTSAQLFSVYNTYTSSTSFEKFSIDWQSETNRCWVGTRTGSAGGTGRTMFVGVGADAAVDYYNGIFFGAVSSTAPITFGQGSENFTVGAGNISGTALTQFTFKGGIFTASSGTQNGVLINNTYNQTGTAGGVDLLIDRVRTAEGSGTHFLMWAGYGGSGVAGTRAMSLDQTGGLFVAQSITTGKDHVRHDLFTGTTSGNQGQVTRLVKRNTAVPDNSATNVCTVTVPNATNAAYIKLYFLASTSGVDLMESTRYAEGQVVVTRTAGVDTAMSAIALSNAGIATVAAGSTLTLAYGVSTLTGASSAQQTFTITATLDTSGNTQAYLNTVIEIFNSESSGITVS